MNGGAVRLGRVNRVRIFSTGLYERGTPSERNWTLRDLQWVVFNFRRLSTGPNPLYRVPLAIGHEEDQLRPERTDALAWGWVEAVWLEGVILRADFGEVQPELVEWLDRGMLRYVSSELYDHPSQGNLPGDGPVLRRVSLLGAHPPHLKHLGQVPAVTYSEPPGRGKIWRVRTYAEARPMEREQMLQALTNCGLPQDFLDGLKDDQLGALVAHFTTGGGGGTPAPTAAAEGTPSKDEIVAELAALGQDPEVLAAMDEAALMELYKQLKPGAAPAPTAAAEGPPVQAPAPAVAPPPPALPALPSGAPSKLIFQYAEAVARVTVHRATQAAEAGNHLARVDQACDELVRAGVVPPALVQAKPVKGPLRELMERTASVRKYGEGKSDFDRLLDTLKAMPVVRKFGEGMTHGGKGGQDSERRRRVLEATPEGRAVLKAERAAK